MLYDYTIILKMPIRPRGCDLSARATAEAEAKLTLHLPTGAY